MRTGNPPAEGDGIIDVEGLWGAGLIEVPLTPVLFIARETQIFSSKSASLSTSGFPIPDAGGVSVLQSVNVHVNGKPRDPIGGITSTAFFGTPVAGVIDGAVMPQRCSGAFNRVLMEGEVK